ncbi:transmembrane anchor protein [Vibrio coralliilyticus]|uniref:transmembrane anchor protein n=1 Tax=Vibrio coralliilyticus TaxID=190893 RepID=UPI000BAAF32E|nr:transmembrane anchor protein [Vibrio coralliilyticus]NOI59699.1 transmembrane anchor protein [Vibrio coralliilyticus]PAT69070.1 transmembrane anchor protein [Vibrio coralliilyticus]
MYNSEIPSRADLPSNKQLVRSTLIALVAAVAVLITVVLPAEYAIDPTGAGRLLGLTEMGEIKEQLAQEAAEDQARSEVASTLAVVKPVAQSQPEAVEEAPSAPEWKDKIIISLKPGQGAEVKLTMEEGRTASFAWASKGGPVNFDTHGDGNGNSISYEKGRGVPEDEGELVAAFTGNHGWFFRNRNDSTVMVILRTSGDYGQMKRVL